jgi:hypothetical protein
MTFFNQPLALRFSLKTVSDGDAMILFVSAQDRNENKVFGQGHCCAP